MIDLIIQKTAEYLAVPSVVGHEQVFMKFLRNDFEKLGLSVFRNDGVLEVQGKKPKEAIICAHIDRHGLISLGDDEYVYAAQYMKEIKYGENNLSSRVQVESIARRSKAKRFTRITPIVARNWQRA